MVPLAMTQKPTWLSKYGNLLSHMTEGPLMGQAPESVDLVAQLYQGLSFFPSLSSAFSRVAFHLG